MNRQFKSMLVTAVVTGASLACHPVSAGIVDLSTFSVTEGTTSLTSSLATLNANNVFPVGRIAGVVENLDSFDFRVQKNDVFSRVDAFVYFPVNGSVIDLAFLFNTNLDTGNLTYRFPAAYSGAIEFGIASEPNSSGTLSIGNLRTTDVISAVPEPETYAMLLAEMGLMGAVVRRRAMRPAPAVVERAE